MSYNSFKYFEQCIRSIVILKIYLEMFYQLDFEHTLKRRGENCLPIQLLLFINVYFLYLIYSKFCMLHLRSFIALLKISILKSILTRRNQKKRKYNVHGFFSDFVCCWLVCSV